jgi:glycerol-3-phosphate dehydrogenase
MASFISSRVQSLQNTSTAIWDVIVIGGGATGCGIALDAASRGLKTLLVEKGDFASGTSGRSTKLIHGGLRYLKNLEFGLVREVGKERAILQRNARHLVARDPMFLPVYEGGELGKTTTSLALWVYEWLAGVDASERRTMLSKEQALGYLPLLQSNGLLGGAKYFEYRTDDARLTLSLALSAQAQGATVLNYVAVKDFLYDATSQYITGVVLKDEIKGVQYETQGRCVVNAAGPWVDHIHALDKTAKPDNKLKGSRGIHIVLSSFDFPLKHAVYFDAIDGRMVFAIPREQKVYVGTTDVFYEGSLENSEIPKKEIDYLIACVKAKFDVPHLTGDSVESAWSGVRPLVLEKGKTEGKISRKDELFVSKSGLVTIAGGKLTGYRKMAERSTDKVCKLLGAMKSCHTEKLQLTGGLFSSDEAFEKFVSSKIMELMAALDVMSYEAELLVTRYGNQTDELIAMIPQANYYAQKYQLPTILAVQVLYAVEKEMALKAKDVYIRRTSDFYFRIEALKKTYKPMIAMMADCLAFDALWMKEQEEEFEAKLSLVKG